MSDAQDDIVDRMLAVVESVTASQRHEAAVTYTLDLSEMYLLKDGTRIMRDRIRELEAEVAALLQSGPECLDCGAHPAQWSGKYWRPCEGCLAYYEHQEVGDE